MQTLTRLISGFLVLGIVFATLVVLAKVLVMWRKKETLRETLRKFEEEWKATRAELAQGKSKIFKASGRYKKRESVMTKAEQGFFLILKKAVPEAPISPK